MNNNLNFLYYSMNYYNIKNTKRNKNKALKKTRKNRDKTKKGGTKPPVTNQNQSQNPNSNEQQQLQNSDEQLQNLKQENPNQDVGLTTIITDGALKMAGLERTEQTPEEKAALQNTIQQFEEDGKNANEIINNIPSTDDMTLGSVVNLASEKVIDTINNPQFEENTEKALDNAKDIAEKTATVANDILENPEVKETINKTAELTGEAIGKGATKAATSLVGAIPGISIPIGLLRAASDITDTIENVTEITKETTELATKQLKELQEEGAKTTERTQNSINEFSNPNPNPIPNPNPNLNLNPNPKPQKGGNRKKTKRLLKKRKMKSKRVRFAL